MSCSSMGGVAYRRKSPTAIKCIHMDTKPARIERHVFKRYKCPMVNISCSMYSVLMVSANKVRSVNLSVFVYQNIVHAIDIDSHALQ